MWPKSRTSMMPNTDKEYVAGRKVKWQSCFRRKFGSFLQNYTLTVGAKVGFFLGFTLCLEFALNSLLWGLQAAFCKLKSVTDLQLALQGFLWLWPQSVGRLERNSVPTCFSVTGLPFWPPVSHILQKPPGYINHLGDISWHWSGLRALRIYLPWVC
jgi:hypothetical protein